MSEDEKLFLKILKDHIHMVEDTKIKKNDVKKIVNYAKLHQLEPIVFKQTKIKELQKLYLAHIYFYIKRKNIIEEIKDKFKLIDYTFVKGNEVAKYYPTPALRSMGDIDLVVRKKDKEIAHNLLINNGFECLGQSNNEWKYSKSEILIELHHELVSNDNDVPIEVSNFFNDLWDYCVDHKLDWNFHFIFLVIHLRNHLIRTGVGFRQFLDLAVIILNVSLDWKWIENTLIQLDLIDFFKKVLYYLEDWFDVVTPIPKDDIKHNIFEEVTNTIFENGVFGISNSVNINNNTINYYRKYGKRGIFINLFRNIFLPYNQLLCMKEYSFLKNRKYLLPIAWIYRIIIKWKNKDKIIKHYQVSEEELNERYTYLREWGLIK